MKLQQAISIPAALAGVWFVTTISPARGQAVHGESIAASAPKVSAPPATNTAAGDGVVLKADFETLASFAFDAPETATTNQAALDKVAKQIPEAIKKLDGKAVRITGFMIPLNEAAGKTTEFLIVRNQATCCFGVAPGLNEFVSVKASGKGIDVRMDDPIAIEGTLHVGLMTDGGFVVGLYQMDCGKKMEPGH